MTEAELQREVQAMCNGLGLLWHHCRDTRTCAGPSGLPDFPLIVGPRGVLIVELKSADGDTSAEQDLWAYTVTKAAEPALPWLDYQLWRPADLESGFIRAELERIANP